MKKNYPVAHKKDHLIVGQKVRVSTVCPQYNMRGVITGIDKRFRNPYAIRLVMDSDGKAVSGRYGHYKGIELAITRFKEA